MGTVVLLLRVGVSLGFVAALLWVVRRRSARWRRKPPATHIEIAGRKSLGQKASVAVVEIGGTRLVLGVTDHGISVLHTEEISELQPAGEETAASAVEAAVTRTTGASGRHTAPAAPAAPAAVFLQADTWRSAMQSLWGKK